MKRKSDAALIRAHEKRMAKTLAKLDRKPPIRVTESRKGGKPIYRITVQSRPTPKLPPCPTNDEVGRAYEVIALDYIYGQTNKRARLSRKEFVAIIGRVTRKAKRYVDFMAEPEMLRILGELHEIRLRVGG